MMEYFIMERQLDGKMDLKHLDQAQGLQKVLLCTFCPLKGLCE